MATIKVGPTVMREKSESIKGIAKSIKTFTDEMKTKIDSLKSTWEGEAAETTVRKFNELSGVFDDCFDTINKFSTFLNNAAEGYEKAEQEVRQAAEGTKSKA